MSAKSSSKFKSLGKTTVQDMMSANSIHYPADPKRLKHKYDFHFTREGIWYYVNSYDDISYAVWGRPSPYRGSCRRSLAGD